MSKRRDPNPPTDPARHQPAAGTPDKPTSTVWHAEAPIQPGALSRRLADRILDSLTETGDVVLDIDDDTVLARAAAESGRRHHGLGGHTHLANLSHTAGYVDLILMHWPQPPANPHLLLAACGALLAQNGSLVIVVHTPPADRTTHLNALTGAAHTAGLPPARHVAVTDDTLPISDGHGTIAHQPGRRDRPPGLPHTDLLIFTLPAAHRG